MANQQEIEKQMERDMKEVKREVVKEFKVRWVDNGSTPATAVVSGLRETRRIEFAPQQGWVAPSKDKHRSCSGPDNSNEILTNLRVLLEDTTGQQSNSTQDALFSLVFDTRSELSNCRP